MMKKFLVGLLSVVMLTSSMFGTVHAADEGSTEISVSGNTEKSVTIPVSASKVSNLVVSIPKTLSLVYNAELTKDEGTFTVTITGDVSGTTEVDVNIIKTFDMTQAGKTSIAATTVIAEDSAFTSVLSTESTDTLYWKDVATCTDIMAVDGYKLYCKVTTDHKLSAGSWNGTLGFRISAKNMN